MTIKTQKRSLLEKQIIEDDREHIDDDDEEVLEDDEEEGDEDDEDLEESADANRASLAPKSKMAMMAQAVNMLAGMKKEDLSHMLTQAMSTIGHEADPIASGSAEKNRASVAMKKSVKEDLEMLFQGDQQLTEDFKNQVETVFEATVGARVNLIEAELQEQFEEKLTEATEQIAETLTEKLDQYLQYVAETWLENNQVAVQSTLRTEIAEDFISGLKDLMIERNFNIPEQETEIAEQLAADLEQSELNNKQLFEQNQQLAVVVNSIIAEQIVNEMSEDMVVSSAEKFKQLAEGLEFDGDVETYAAKLETLKETYFPDEQQGEYTTSLDEDTLEEGPAVKKVAPGMEHYVQAISRSIVK